ncbi:hypothetical protein DFH09DRAFT_1337118 [Mycena vulgaris]|nr:hypothetical protein DFH09DRAFT_1337118 [Mycena vulgaris]
MQQLATNLPDNFAPDDENDALVYPNLAGGQEAEVPRRSKHLSEPTKSGDPGLNHETGFVEKSMKQSPPELHRRTHRHIPLASGTVLGSRGKKPRVIGAAAASSSMHERAHNLRGYAGTIHGGPPPAKGLIEISMGNGSPVSVYDSNGLKTVYRDKLCDDPLINSACMEMAALVLKIQPTFDTGQDRGNFKTYYFSLHRGSVKTPRMSKDISDHPDLFATLQTVGEPVRAHIHRIFKGEFPLLEKRYAAAADTIHAKYPHLQAAFYPFASFCINVSSHGVVTVEHIDPQNLGPGLCGVIPFGSFDPSKDCKLHVKELGYTFQLAAGTPIFFPSALYTHYNSKLISLGMRGSIVVWTGASIFQYVDLGCRAVKELNKAEVLAYHMTLKEHVLAGFDLFPRQPM